MSLSCTTSRRAAIRPIALAGSGTTTGSRFRYSRYAEGAPCVAPMRKFLPSRSQRLPNFASQIRVAFASIVWKTGSSSLGVVEITRSTSDVAVCRSSASCNSLVSRAISVSWSAAGEPRRSVVFRSLRRFSVAGPRRCALAGLPPALERRFIAFTWARDMASYRLGPTLRKGQEGFCATAQCGNLDAPDGRHNRTHAVQQMANVTRSPCRRGSRTREEL